MRWHPTRPGVFASVLGNGRAELWDVCRSVLEPVAVFLREGKLESAALYSLLQYLVASALSKRRVTHDQLLQTAGPTCRCRLDMRSLLWQQAEPSAGRRQRRRFGRLAGGHWLAGTLQQP